MIEGHKNKIRGVLSQTQITRLLAHCEAVNHDHINTIGDFEEAKMYHQIEEEQLGNFYVNLGWIQALRTVLKADTDIANSPIDDKYRKAYGILMDMFHHIPEDEKQAVHIALKELGL